MADRRRPPVLLEAGLRAHMLAGEISRQSVLAQIPEDASDRDLAKRAFLNLANHALPAVMFPGIVSTLRDRWARRVLTGICMNTEKAVRQPGSDVFKLVVEAVQELDRVNAIRARRDAGTLAESMQLLREEQGAVAKAATTGTVSLDARLGGYRRGQLYVVAGRPGMGKSALPARPFAERPRLASASGSSRWR